MVQRYDAAVSDLDIEAKAKALGFTPHDVMTVASIVQAEGKLPSDFPKIARVLYNRLDKGQPLQLDTTIVYIFRTKGKLTTSAAAAVLGLAVQHLQAPRPAARRRSPRPGRRPSRRRCRRRRAPWLYFVTTDPSNGAIELRGQLRRTTSGTSRSSAPTAGPHDC